jgi:hypothetical protein
MARDDVAHRGACMDTEEKVCRRNKKKEEVERHRVQTQNTEAWCTQTLYAPNKKAVCENIEHRNHEYEGWENM